MILFCLFTCIYYISESNVLFQVAPSAGSEYQSAVAAAMGAFMHENPQSCALDVKPSGVSSSGANGNNKQREGSEYDGASGGMFNGNFESSYGATPYGHGIHAGGYSPQSKGGLGGAAQVQSPNKPRNKSRTSAGKPADLYWWWAKLLVKALLITLTHRIFFARLLTISSQITLTSNTCVWFCSNNTCLCLYLSKNYVTRRSIDYSMNR